MNIKIFNTKTHQEVDLYNNEFIIDENQEYSVRDESQQLTEQDFQSIGTWINPEIGILKSTNKVGIFRLKDVSVRVRSKLGDDFFQKIKEEIANIEKQLLLSSNGIEENLALSYGHFLEDVAFSQLLESWHNGKAHSSLRFIFANPSFGFATKGVVKNLSRGDVLSDIDFQYMQKSSRQFSSHNGKVIPITFPSAIRHQTNDVLEMRFIKFFLFFCFNLLERRVRRQKDEVSELKKYIDKLIAVDKDENKQKKLLAESKIFTIKKLIETQTIKLKINSYLRSETLKQVKFTGDLDFTSLKLHNNFHFKCLLKLYLNMRKSFEPLNSDNLVYLDIDSLENLYEYYCFIKLLKDFEVKPEFIDKLIKKDRSGWVIDKSIPVYIGNNCGYSFTLYFKKNFGRGTGSYSQSYAPDYTITLIDDKNTKLYLHLDAKYKHTSGYVKKEDIDKMHTYAHAIKKSKGAIVLFPGSHNTIFRCDETIIGAFFCSPIEEQNIKDKIFNLFNKI